MWCNKSKTLGVAPTWLKGRYHQVGVNAAMTSSHIATSRHVLTHQGTALIKQSRCSCNKPGYTQHAVPLRIKNYHGPCNRPIDEQPNQSHFVLTVGNSIERQPTARAQHHMQSAKLRHASIRATLQLCWCANTGHLQLQIPQLCQLPGDISISAIAATQLPDAYGQTWPWHVN